MDPSALWRMVTGAFGTNYPMRLAIGASFACLSQTVVTVLSRVAPDVELWQALSGFGTTWYLIVITPWFFISIAFGKQGAPEGVVQQINVIRALIAEAGFAPTQRMMIWRSLVDKYLRALQPDFSRAANLRSLYDDVQKEVTPDPTATP